MPDGIRVNRWTGADLSERIEFAQSIPSSPDARGNYETVITEHPREDFPSSIRATDVPTVTEISLDLATYVYEGNPNTNYGASDTLITGRDGSGFAYRYYTLLGHSANRPAVIESAAMHLTLKSQSTAGYPGEQRLGVHLLEGALDEQNVTWNNMAGHTVIAYSAFEVTEAGLYVFDVTAAYVAQSNNIGIFGFLIKSDNDQETDNFRNFHSDTGGSTPDRPKLVVTATSANYEEVPWTVEPQANQFAVHYPTGKMRFHSSNAGEIWYFRLFARGPKVGPGFGGVALREDVWTGADESVLKSGSVSVPASPNYRARDYEIELEEIPRADSPSTVEFTNGGVPLTEVPQDVEPGPGEFGINYLRGYARFNAAEAGVSLNYQYYGRGTPIRGVPASGQIDLREDHWTQEDLSVEITENLTVPASPNYTGEIYEVALSEIPRQDDPTSVTVTIGGNDLAELPAEVTPGNGQFSIQYTTGHVRFPANYAGQNFSITYFGRGTPIR